MGHTLDLSKEQLELETRVYRFLHQVNIVIDTAKRLQRRGAGLGLNMRAEQGAPLTMEMETPDLQTITELAVVIEPLVRHTSDIHFEAILEVCRQAKPSPELEALVEEATKGAKRIRQGAMQLNLNGEVRTPEWIYERFMDKMVNAGDVEAHEYEANLRRDPFMRNLLIFQFYDYCMNMIAFLDWLRGRIKAGKHLPKGAPRHYLCILCRRHGEETSFTKAEHTLPEALGNTHSILPRGYYCDDCQSLLAPVEAVVVNSMPFAMTRLWFTKHNKSGQFPSARFGSVHYKKTRPNHLLMDVFAGKQAFPKTKDVGDGKVSMTLTGSSRFDHRALGRVLVKAALGGMVLEKGRDYVLDPRFDPARQFVRTGQGLHARLIMARKSAPRPELEVRWWDFADGSAGVVLVVHGIEFAFPATPVSDETPPSTTILEHVEVFDLWSDAPTPHYRRASPESHRPEEPVED